MSKTIVIIDYGMGNLLSVQNSMLFLQENVIISSDPKIIRSASCYILPGVGAFGQAMENLHNRFLIEVLNEQVLERQKPILGICLGMQLFANSSEEMGHTQGLGWIPSKVVPFDSEKGLKIPHVGWNNLQIEKDEPILKNIGSETDFYFDHSYHVVCDNEYSMATCNYGGEVVAAVRRGNIIGTQFHPEKSQNAGLRILKNYINAVKK